MSFIVGAAFGVILFLFGWVMAHETVAKECERLGGFFVGSKVYRCTKIEGNE